MSILYENRSLPSRRRVTDVTSTVNGTFQFPGYVKNCPYLIGSYSEIYDEKGPKSAWKDCVHTRYDYHPTVYTGTYKCPTTDLFPVTFTNFGGRSDILFTPAQDIMGHDRVQAAFQLVASRWFDKLHQVCPDELPDLAVFMAEVREMDQLWTIVKDFLFSLVKWLRILSRNKRAMRQQHRSDKKLSGRGQAARRKLERERDEIIKRGANDLLGMRFGVQQPIRDLSKLIASLYGYITTFEFSTKVISVREIVNLNFASVPFYTGCSHGSYAATCPKDREGLFSQTEDVRVQITATTKRRSTFDGSRLEKLIVILMRQFAVTPTLDVLWELTPLSWLVDYIFNTQRLISKFNGLSESYAGITPIIFQTAVSLSIESEAKSYWPCALYGIDLPAERQVTRRYYERNIGVPGTDLAKFAGWINSPGTTQKQNASAFLIQLAM